MSKKVVHAELHDGFFVPGVANGNFTKTLPNPNKTLKNFRMSLQDSGSLLCEWDEGAFVKSFTVAAANVKVSIHASEPIKTELPKK
jgi:hypothetical protein